MRSAVIAAAFAVGALAVPYQQNKRDVVTNVQYETVYQTDVVTVTAGGNKAEASPEQKHGGHHKWGGWGHGWNPKHNDKPNKPKHTPDTYNPPKPKPKPTNDAPKPKPPKPQPNPKPPKPSGGGGAPAPPADGSYNEIATYHHNIHRANHSAPDLQWSDEVAAGALQVAQSCVYAHDTDVPDAPVGQNIAAGVEAGNISAIITNMFYNGEIGYYEGLYGQDSPDMSNFHLWGHFSQIIWKGTTEFGCATVDCSGQGLANVGGNVPPYFTVCNYKSPGNMAGAYAENIGEPLGKPSADWSTGMNM